MEDVAEQLRTRKYGFLSLSLAQRSVIEDLFAVSAAFHRSPLQKRLSLRIDKSLNNRGFIPSSADLPPHMGDYKDIPRGYATLDFGICDDFRASDGVTNVLCGPNEMPNWIPDFSRSLEAAIKLFFDLSQSLFECLCDSIGYPRHDFPFGASENCSQIRLLHYLAGSPDRAGIKPHTDYEFFTFLCSTLPGLRVLDEDQNWITVDEEPNRLVVLAGDCLEIWSNGKVRAASHRADLTDKERFSIAYFASIGWQQKLLSVEASEIFTPSLHQAKFAVRNNRHLRNALYAGHIALGVDIQDKNTFGDH